MLKDGWCLQNLLKKCKMNKTNMCWNCSHGSWSVIEMKDWLLKLVMLRNFNRGQKCVTYSSQCLHFFTRKLVSHGLYHCVCVRERDVWGERDRDIGREGKVALYIWRYICTHTHDSYCETELIGIIWFGVHRIKTWKRRCLIKFVQAWIMFSGELWLMSNLL